MVRWGDCWHLLLFIALLSSEIACDISALWEFI